jgi:hypothetical protein
MMTLTRTHPQAASVDSAEVTTVLVVDDHQAVRLGIQMLLDDEPGIEVVASASSYDEGLVEAERLLPSLRGPTPSSARTPWASSSAT